MRDDDAKSAILVRRARFIARALASSIVVAGCGAKSGLPEGGIEASEVGVAPDALPKPRDTSSDTNRPIPCLDMPIEDTGSDADAITSVCLSVDPDAGRD